jgi:hypothetical protein
MQSEVPKRREMRHKDAVRVECSVPSSSTQRLALRPVLPNAQGAPRVASSGNKRLGHEGNISRQFSGYSRNGEDTLRRYLRVL